jgi:starvation-inducible outer membrane lipoprotein
VPIKTNILKDKRGKELAKWEGYRDPKELKRTIKQCVRMGGKIVVSWS